MFGIPTQKYCENMPKISEQPHIFLMHAAISYYFIQIVDMNRVEKQNKCMGLYRNFYRLTQN